MADHDESIAPKIFISYSHDDREHKQWVYALASALEKAGLDVAFDQWDVEPGDDLARYMTDAISGASRILVVCTERYRQKAESGMGGVGFESTVVTGELVKASGTNRFVPIVRVGQAISRCVPAFLGPRYVSQLTGPGDPDEEWEKLIRTLHGTPIPKPARGTNPFAEGGLIRKDDEASVSVASEIEQTSPAIVLSKEFQSIARARATIQSGDVGSWRLESQKVLSSAIADALRWRETAEQNLPAQRQDLPDWLWGVVDCFAPVFVRCFEAVRSQADRVSNQTPLVTDLTNLRGWTGGGRTQVVSAPYAIAGLYQAILGALYVFNEQFDAAWELVQYRPALGSKDGDAKLFQFGQVTSWLESLDQDSDRSARWLLSAWDHWGWLNQFFPDQFTFQTSLLSYYTLLGLAEFDRTSFLVKTGAVTIENLAEDWPSVLVPYPLYSDEVRAASIREVYRFRKNLLAKLKLENPSNTDPEIFTHWARRQGRAQSNSFRLLHRFLYLVGRDVLSLDLKLTD